MFIVDEMEFERLSPVCSCCGDYLTPDEWELYGDVCANCFEEELEKNEE